MSGVTHRQHVTADVSGVDAALLDDAALLRELALRSAVDGGATVLGELCHKFDPQGVSLVLLLAESHLSVHTWPEAGCCYVDVFTCGDVDPTPILGMIVDRLGGVTRFTRLGSAPLQGTTSNGGGGWSGLIDP